MSRFVNNGTCWVAWSSNRGSRWPPILGLEPS
jgi:hypothetical protein